MCPCYINSIIFFLVWCIVGALGFAFWWTRDFGKITKSEINSKVMMRFTWVDTETGDKDENLFGANGQNDWDKGVGSALTYGERYFLLKYFHIATDEDDIDNPDRVTASEVPKQEAKKPYLERGTPQFLSVTNAILKGSVPNIEMVKKKYELLEPIENELEALIKKTLKP